MFNQQKTCVFKTRFNSLLYVLLQLSCQFIPKTVSTTCNSRLLADRIQVPDSSFEHSTAVNSQHGAAAARDDPSDLGLQERAWCPELLVHTELREFMQIDLGHQSVIKMIITKGRVAQSKGRQSTPYFYIKYRRERTSMWFEYRKENGTQRFTGNQDAMTENYNAMEPPFVARYVRIYPYSLEPVKTCLKLEILGCDAAGIVEYQIPQGTLISDSIYPSFIPESRAHQTRFQDQTYDSYSNTYQEEELSAELMQQASTVSTTTSQMLRGGLGKLTDNDTESNPLLSPFSSFKYVGWKRPLYYSRTKRHIPSLTNRWNRSNRGQQYYVGLLFRFDSMYKFTAIHLFLSNDFHNDISLPSNISVRISFDDPSTGTGRETPSAPIYLAPLPDHSHSSSRWITVLLQPICLVHVSGASHHGDQSLNSTHVSSPRSFSCLGQFVEIKLYFMTDWIVLGEVAFENYKVNTSGLNFQPRVSETMNKSVRKPATPAPVPAVLFDATLSQNTPTTLTLSIICGVLATLICMGILCMLCVWRRKRLLRTGLLAQLRKRTSNRSAHFDSLSNRQVTNFTKLSNQNGSNGTSHLIGPRSVDVQAQFQHPHHCQEQNQPYLTSTHLYSSQLASPFTLSQSGLPQTSLLPVVDPVRSYQYPVSGSMVPKCSEHASHSISNSLNRSAEIVQFLPLTPPQVTQTGYLNHTIPCSFAPNDSYRKVGPDNAIYTSLPGSDCDSHSYDRVVNGGPLHSPGILVGAVDENVLPTTTYMEANTCLGSIFDTVPQFRTSLVPPPPTLPLPPIPTQKYSPQLDRRQSPSNGTDELVDSGVSMINSQLKDISPCWSTSMAQTRTNQVWIPANMLTAEQVAGGQMPSFYAVQGSDYSNVTMGSSTNGYGAYYSASPPFDPRTAAYPLQNRR